MGLCALWSWPLNSLIVVLMEEKIRFLVQFNTAVPLAPALVASQWAAWLEGGRCRVTRLGEQWSECRVSTISPLYPLCYSGCAFPPANLANQWQLSAVEGEYAHLYWHIHKERKEEVSGGWKDWGEERKRCTIVCADVTTLFHCIWPE